MATIIGTSGNDTLVGFDTDDTIWGLGGGDTLDGGKGDDALDGGEDGDTYRYNVDPSALATAFWRSDTAEAGGTFVRDTGTQGTDIIQVENGAISPGPKLALLGLGSFGPESGIEEIHGSTAPGIRTTIIGTEHGGDRIDLSAVTLWNIATIHGDIRNGDGNDTIIGNNQANAIFGDGGSDIVYGGDGNDWLNGGSGDDTMVGGEGADQFSLASADQNLDVHRAEFIELMNARQFIYPGTNDGPLLTQIEIELGSPGSESAKFKDAVEVGAATGAVLAIVGAAAGPVGAAVGAFGGFLIGYTAYKDRAAAENQHPPEPKPKDPFIGDLFLADRVEREGQDITDDLVAYASNHAESIARFGGDAWVAFLERTAFSPLIRDAAGTPVEQLYGSDTLLIRVGQHTTFGIVTYNDPTITGRELLPTDVIELNFDRSGLGAHGDTLALFGTPVVATSRLLPNPGADRTGQSLINVGTERVEDFDHGTDQLKLGANLDFRDLDVDGNGILDTQDSPVITSSVGGIIMDIGAALGAAPGLATVSLAGVTQLDASDFLFS